MVSFMGMIIMTMFKTEAAQSRVRRLYGIQIARFNFFTIHAQLVHVECRKTVLVWWLRLIE